MVSLLGFIDPPNKNDGLDLPMHPYALFLRQRQGMIEAKREGAAWTQNISIS